MKNDYKIAFNKKFWFLYFLMLALELIIAGFILSRLGLIHFVGGDSLGYMSLAKNLVEHGVFSFADNAPFVPTNFRTPGYPLFLAVIYFIFHSFLPAMFLGAIVAAFAAPLVYLIGREIFSETIAFWSGFLIAIEPTGLLLGVSILTEGIFTPVLLLSVYFFVKYLKTARTRQLYWFSVFLGLAVLIRPILFYFWPVVIPFIFYKEKNFSWRLSLRKIFISGAILVLILSPWLIRNKIVMNSWQVAGLQGYVFFIDHYGAVLRYLGQANTLDDVQNRALALVGPDKIFTPEGSDILFRTALKEIKSHKLAYLNIYSKSLIPFFLNNGYRSFFIDTLGIPVRIPFVPFELFLRFNFKSILETLNNVGFLGVLIYCGGKILWIIISVIFLASLIFLIFKKEYKSIRVKITFLAVVIFYFALIIGPTAIGGSRTRAPINGLIFMFTVFGAIKFFEFLKRKLT